MNGAIIWAVAGSLLLTPTTPAIAVYPRAAEIKRACASVIQKHFKDVQEQYKNGTTPQAEQDEIVDGWIESYSNMSIEEAKKEWGWSGSDFTKCIVDQLETHWREGKIASNNSAPKKGTQLRHILKLGSQCINAKMLGTLNTIVEIELSNDCTTTQVVATYVEVDGQLIPSPVNVFGPGYAEWKGKLPALAFQAVEPYPMTMYPNQRVTFHVSEGQSTTVKTAACDYVTPGKVYNRLFTDATLDGFTQYVCPPNPQPEPKPFPFR